MVAIIIFAVAFFVRIYNLTYFPLNHDEANWIIPCLEHFDTFLGIPVSGFSGYIRPFMSWLVFFSEKLFSIPEYIVRVPAVIVGTATVVVMYLLAKEMYGKRTGLISALLLSLLPWHVIQSRDGREIITTPFFGCLIALALLHSLKKQNNAWFALFWVFLAIGSFYTYWPSILYIAIFLAIMLLLRKDFYWVKPKVLLLSLGVFFAIVYPLVYLGIRGEIPQFLGKYYWAYFGENSPMLHNPLAMFTDALPMFLSKMGENFKNNISSVLESLFFASRGRMLYGAALEAPLLITKISLPIILASLVISLRQRKASDKILLAWIALGLLGGLLGVRFFQPRYIIVALVPFVILIGRAIDWIFNYAIHKPLLKRRLLFFSGVLLCAGLVFAEIFQLTRYYLTAVTHLEECRRNSYGCKQAAEYLSQVPNVRNYQIITGSRMTVSAYLDYFQNKKGYAKKSGRMRYKGAYYAVWAPESHPRDYWGGLFRQVYDSFRQKYPEDKPIKTIYYPNGIAAIYIFKSEEDIFPR